jgi:hypothetical protein
MAEYYAVLKKAVSGLDTSAVEARRTVYDKARNALIGQLKAIDPPLPTSEISRQRLDLEEAIRRVERESAAGGASASLARPAASMQAVSVSAAASSFPASVAEAPEPTPQDVFRRAIQEAEARGAAAVPSLERAPVPARAESQSGGSAEFRRSERQPPPEPAYVERPGYGRQTAEPEPRLAPDYDYEWEAAPPASPQPQPSPFVDRRDRPATTSRRRKGYLQDDDRELAERPSRPSRLPAILLFFLIVAMLGGLGALAWSQRAKIEDILSTFDSGKTAKPVAASPQPAGSTKAVDRLLPPQPTDKPVRVVEAPAGQDAGAETTTPAPANDTAPAVAATPPSDVAPIDVAPPAPAPAQANDASGNALVAQKAILYEEPLDAAGAANGVTAINAAVTWQFVTKGANGPEIQAILEVPERKLKIRLEIHKNSDETLPASHLVEVVIDAPADFPGKGIRTVPRLVMKPTEEARGQPLIGASAKVADGFFWIALSSTDTDVAANLALIRERNWIDLPLVYETGQRAILTFEKGTPGDRVFQKALAAWGS